MGFGEAVFLDKFLDFFFCFLDFTDNPVFAHVGGFDLSEVELRSIVEVGVEGVAGFVDDVLDEAGDVPELITEVAASDDSSGAESLRLGGGAVGDEAEAEGVGAVFGDDGHRIDDVAFGFAHFDAVFVEDEAVEIDFLERNFIFDVEAEHNHARHPGKN